MLHFQNEIVLCCLKLLSLCSQKRRNCCISINFQPRMLVEIDQGVPRPGVVRGCWNELGLGTQPRPSSHGEHTSSSALLSSAAGIDTERCKGLVPVDVDVRHMALGLPVVLMSPGGAWLTGKTHPGLGLLPPRLGIWWSSAGSQVLAEMPGSGRGHGAAEVWGGGPTAWQGLVSAGAWSEADFSNMMSTHYPAPRHHKVLSPSHCVTTRSCPWATVSPHGPFLWPSCHHTILFLGHHVTIWSCPQAIVWPCGPILRATMSSCGPVPRPSCHPVVMSLGVTILPRDPFPWATMSPLSCPWATMWSGP